MVTSCGYNLSTPARRLHCREGVKMEVPSLSMSQPLSAPEPYVFDLDGGRVCLDFANTLGGRSGEHLNSYADLIAFAAQSKLLTREDAAWLQAEGKRDTETAAGVMVRAKRLRTIMRGIFSRVAACKTPTESDLDGLNFDLAATLSHARVLPSGSKTGGYVWGWTGRNLDAP